MKKTTSWILFLSPGTIVSNESTVECSPGIDPTDVEWPENAYCFTINERDVITDDGETFKGKARQVGPIYYHPDSVVEDYDAVKRNPNATRILIDNMRCNKWGHIVWNRWGTWPQPFDPSTCVVLGLEVS